MADPATRPGRPALYTIPSHRTFADALAAGLIRRSGGDRMALARGLVILPSDRARRAVTDAFVRASGGALLMPRLVSLGDPALDEASGAALDAADDADPAPPAIPPGRRRMILARLVQGERARAGVPVDAGEAVRLAGELARTLDQLLVEDVAPAALREIELGEELSVHWRRALASFSVILDQWPAELKRLGLIDLADRRARLLGRLEQRWRATPPAGFVCAAGITDPAPSVARLLRCVADMADGAVVFAGLDRDMPDDEWDALGPYAPDPVTGVRRRSLETHPQFHLKLLLERMSVARGEVRTWRGDGARDGGGRHAGAARGRAVANALAPARFTGKWTELPADERRLTGITVAELATPAEEAQAIALALREALETPGRTAALVTPDRALARRVAAHLGRWDIPVEDTAGRPLSILPPGTLLLALAEAAAQRFAPLPLLTLLKHPLVRSGEARLPWLDGVRQLDRCLRGPRPAPGLVGIDAHLADGDAREAAIRRAAVPWWGEARALLAPLAGISESGAQPPASLVATLREVGTALCGDALWSGPAGRMAATFLADLEIDAADGPALVEPEALPAMLTVLLETQAVRPANRGHPRLAIYGLIEARLQTADLMVLGGLNEGTWPGRPAPDPWLAPRIRVELGLPALERRVGIAAHDLGQALGAPAALVTRARRDARSPALASRFWLRLEAMAGDRFERARSLEGWTRALDDPGEYQPSPRPEPSPPPALRPRAISVTEVDRLKADPYAFYARRVLGLSPLDAVDADPSAAWRGTAVHAILEAWAQEDGCRPDALKPRAAAMLAEATTHPMMRALWQPRLLEAIDWIAGTIAANREDGRDVLAAEGHGRIEIAGVKLSGRFDRIDRLADGGLAVIDYKTGKPPSSRAVRDGFSLQLGLLGLIVERGGFDGVAGKSGAFEYWSLAKKGDAFGYMQSPCDLEGKRDRIATADFVAIAAENFADAAGDWLTGNRAFTAKLKPDYAVFAEYDQLMRRDEWYGRER